MDDYSKGEPMELDAEGVSCSKRYCKTGDFHLVILARNGVGERDAVIYHCDDVIVQNNVDFPDEFYVVTPEDVKAMHQDLQNKRVALEDAPLLTARMRALLKDQDILRKTKEHPKTVVRIRFSNRYVLQGTFSTLDKIAAVADFTSKFLENPAADFYLFTTPPKKILLKEVTLVEEGLIGLVVIYFGSPNAVTLKSELFSKLSDPDVIFEKLRLFKNVGDS